MAHFARLPELGSSATSTIYKVGAHLVRKRMQASKCNLFCFTPKSKRITAWGRTLVWTPCCVAHLSRGLGWFLLSGCWSPPFRLTNEAKWQWHWTTMKWLNQWLKWIVEHLYNLLHDHEMNQWTCTSTPRQGGAEASKVSKLFCAKLCFWRLSLEIFTFLLESLHSTVFL